MGLDKDFNSPTPTLKWSSMRKGVKLRSLGVPIERRTVAPAPSDCSRASKKVWIPRGFGAVAFKDGSAGGITGRPWKFDDGAAMVERVLLVLNLSTFESVLSVLFCKKGLIQCRKVSCW